MSLDAVEIILAKFYERKARNPVYSMRAFSRDLQMSSGELSEILSNKRSLTLRKALRVSERLFSSLEDRDRFLFAVVKCHHDTGEPSTSTHSISNDTFQLIADWQHFAILSLVETNKFNPSPEAVAKRLGISKKLATDSIARLLRLGLLKKVGRKLIRCEDFVSTTHDIPSSALRHSHRQSLEQAIEALEKYSVDEREFISCTLSFDKMDMPAAKKAIREFAHKFKASLPRKCKEEVYNLNIQLVPVTQLREKI